MSDVEAALNRKDLEAFHHGKKEISAYMPGFKSTTKKRDEIMDELNRLLPRKE